ncbi:MAG: hypothetical protein ACK4M4_01310 [Flavobacterium sp.]
MKNAAKFIILLSLCFTIFSCKSEAEKKVDKTTTDYVRFVDSVTTINTPTLKNNWSKIEKLFETKTTELNLKIDKLENSSTQGIKMDSATNKFESLKKSLFGSSKEPNYNAATN